MDPLYLYKEESQSIYLNKFQCDFLCSKLWTEIIAGNYSRKENLEDIPDSLFTQVIF